jgi:hypothetical protein
MPVMTIALPVLPRAFCTNKIPLLVHQSENDETCPSTTLRINLQRKFNSDVEAGHIILYLPLMLQLFDKFRVTIALRSFNPSVSSG